jgi:glycosyltransferase involved in cell wall biosynthesis
MKTTLLFVDTDNREFNPVLNGPNHFDNEFNIIRANSDSEVFELLASEHVSLIVTAEATNEILFSKFPKLFTELPSYWKSKWFNFSYLETLSSDVIAENLMSFFATTLDMNNNFFSIVTPVYHTRPDVFNRTYESLKQQTLKDWEWIIIDDSKDLKKTQYIKDIAEKDFRIKYYSLGHSGVIGEVKRRGFSLAEGQWLLELDHDDEILPNTLQKVKDVFLQYPEVGFVFSNCAEIEINKHGEVVGFRNYARDENGVPTKNPWGNSRTGTAEEFEWKGVTVLSNVSPQVNSQSIRHITSAGNHLRCWDKDVYFKAGKHSSQMHIVDDYELMVRTFMVTQFAHLNSTEYIQYYEVDGSVNTQYNRFGEIQKLTHYVSKHYDSRIHERFKELGVEDYCWDEKEQMGKYWIDRGVIPDNLNVNIKV